ncbi:MAG: YicC family protein [Alphaproteobacteria bacterium]|nr:YicC family protein [Alphaproteobacteria bacterium]
MTAISMTGFARSRGSHGTLEWTWELKSVNGRGLEIRFRLPPGFDALEVQARQALQARLKRGSVQVTLSLAEHAQAPSLRINREALTAISEAIRAMENIIPMQPASADGLLRIKGVLEEDAGEAGDADARDAAMLASLLQGIDALIMARAEEGARISIALQGQLARIAAIATESRGLASLAPEAVRQRLADTVARLLESSTALNPDRLHQEAALLATRADVTEELDRLDAHVHQAHELLNAGEPAGRRLDFLCQEFTREANTLCSKSFDIKLTRLGLDLKAVIEQFREQVQNVE